jgi:lipoprotein-anchoring transpeptidase ErfK/SrfK
MWWLGVAVAGLLYAGELHAGDTLAEGRWTEEDFNNKARLTKPYAFVPGRDLATADTVIGSVRQFSTAQGDTFLDLARFYGLGYNELEQANPGIDPWIPGLKAKALVLPTAWVLPQSSYEGVVVNIPEMRLYYYHPVKAGQPRMVTTYPVGLGRDEWRTPQGKFKVQGKTKNPTWVIPESIRQEHIKERGDHRTMIEGGAADNPLGKYRLELTMPGYRIHGTDIPWGVGMQVSHGCVRVSVPTGKPSVSCTTSDGLISSRTISMMSRDMGWSSRNFHRASGTRTMTALALSRACTRHTRA